MRKNEHYIYKWTNLENNKCYIGKTNNKECRYNWFINWDDHYAGPHIDKARKKYNDLKYWKYEILCQCSNEDELNEKEKYYIALYDSNNKYHGYNISSGGTWGDTFYALTEEERKARLEKQISTVKSLGYRWMYKGDEQKKIDKYHQQEYLENGWSYGLSKLLREKLSISVKNSVKCKECALKRRLPDYIKEERKKEKEQKLKEYRNSKEYKEKIEANKEKARQRIIAYNTSDAHKKAAIESNKRRWLNGCPEETREKMRKTQRERFNNTKICWINNNTTEKMIDISDLEKYIKQGFLRGRLHK